MRFWYLYRLILFMNSISIDTYLNRQDVRLKYGQTASVSWVLGVLLKDCYVMTPPLLWAVVSSQWERGVTGSSLQSVARPSLCGPGCAAHAHWRPGGQWRPAGQCWVGRVASVSPRRSELVWPQCEWDTGHTSVHCTLHPLPHQTNTGHQDKTHCHQWTKSKSLSFEG